MISVFTTYSKSLFCPFQYNSNNLVIQYQDVTLDPTGDFSYQDQEGDDDNEDEEFFWTYVGAAVAFIACVVLLLVLIVVMVSAWVTHTV